MAGSTVASLSVEITGDISGLNRALSSADKSVKGSGRGILGMLDGIGAGWKIAGGAALAFGVDAMRASIQFETAMTNANSILQLSQTEIGALSDKILDIGGASRAGPQAAAEAFYEIVSGVADATTHVEILNAAIAVSEAGNANLTGTTAALISIMNSYSFAAEDAAMVSDILTKTVGVGVGSMDEFGQAFGATAGLAAAAKIDLSELGASLGYVTTKGFSAAEAGTQLTGIITAFLKPNEKMKKALQKMGFESGSAALEALGLTGAVDGLNDAVGGSVDGMADALGRVEALRGALALSNPDFAEFLANFEATTAGATDAARAIQNVSTQAKLDQLSSQFDRLKISAGEALAPLANAAINITTTAVTAAADIFTEAKELGENIGRKIQEGIDAGLTIGEILLGVSPDVMKFEPKEVGGAIRNALDDVLISLGNIPVDSPVYVNLEKIQVAADVADTIVAALNAQVGDTKPLAILASAAINLVSPEAAAVVGVFDQFISDLNAYGLSPTQSMYLNTMIELAYEPPDWVTTFNNVYLDGVAASAGWGATPIGVRIEIEPEPELPEWQQIVLDAIAREGRTNPLIAEISAQAELTPIVDREAFNTATETILNQSPGMIMANLSVTPNIINTPEWIQRATQIMEMSSLSASLSASVTVQPHATILPTGIAWVDAALAGVGTAIGAAQQNAPGNAQDVDGAHRTGLSFVPNDNYTALLHRGERVLTANENRAYTSGRGGGGATVNIYGGVFPNGPQEFAEYVKTVLQESGY